MTTTVKMTKEERAKELAAKRELPAFTRMKIRMSAKNDIVITIPASEFEHKKLVEGDNLAKVEKEFGTTKNGNVLIGTSQGYLAIQKEGFEHIKINVSAVSSNKEIKEEIANRMKKAEMQALASEIKAERGTTDDKLAKLEAENAELKDLMKQLLAKLG